MSLKAEARDGIGRDQWLVLIAAFLGWMFDGLEMGIFPLVARPALAELAPPELIASGKVAGYVGEWMGYITALFLLGAASGGFLFGWLGDRIGRVRAMALSILTYSVFTGLCYFSTAAWHLGALRFVAALGMGGEWSLGVALVMECWPGRLRTYLAAAIGAAANVGFAAIAVLGWLFPIQAGSWRWVMLVGAAPALLTFLIRLFVPESERWKAAVRERAAHPLREVFSPPLLRPTLLAIAFAGVALVGTWGSVQWLPLWADELVDKRLPEAKAFTQVSQSFGAILGCIVAPLIGGRLGRRPTYALLCAASLLLCQGMFHSVSDYGASFLVLAFFVGAASASFYGWLPLYLPELFPTRARATGQGVGFNTGRILAAVGAILGGQLVKYFGSYPQAGAVVTLVYVLGMVLIWLAPETKDKPLPD